MNRRLLGTYKLSAGVRLSDSHIYVATNEYDAQVLDFTGLPIEIVGGGNTSTKFIYLHSINE